MTPNLASYLKKSEEQLATAKTLAAITPTTPSIVHNCYYAFFWAVRGLLTEKGVIVKKHSGAHQMFGLHYIKTGDVPGKSNDYLYDLFEQRLIAYYDVEGEFDAEQITTLIQRTEEFLNFVREKYA
ncbi:HEPN domain-containing protein [Nibrella saemangeumensis]|uniref:HEPN domain-containing protein n=1 Tax=Nibrella saemangeumensis TaxID=1084526 RepID=A0ABP8NJN0_9BACT